MKIKNFYRCLNKRFIPLINDQISYDYHVLCILKIIRFNFNVDHYYYFLKFIMPFL